MRVVVGPVSANSAAAWIGHARGILDDLDALAPGECFSTPEVREIFDGYLSEWEAIVREDEKFVWEREIPTEQVEIVDTLPRNPTGKVLKFELRDRFG